MPKKTAAVFAPTPEYIPCAFAGCPTSATIRARTKTGWANVCPDHDKAIVQKSADEYCKALGLHTTAQKRAWLLSNAKGGVRRVVERQREPGDDDEPIRETEIAI